MAAPTQIFQRSKADVLSLIALLVQRPSRADHGLPLIWLSGQSGGIQILDALDSQLDGLRRYKVPNARVRADETVNAGFRQLLSFLARKLSVPEFRERLWFRRYGLVEWLMEQNLAEPGSVDPPTRLVELLRDRYQKAGDENNRSPSGRASVAGSANPVEAIFKFLMWLFLHVVPNALFRATVSGKIPGIGRRYRWFMRQPYMRPWRSVDFLGFAERLTEGVRRRQDDDEIDQLLVRAFLEDLRRAYSRKPWRIEGWRRTAYTIVLIDNIAPGGGGARLLELINKVRNEDVRNETGKTDPLLVVCASDQVLPTPATTTANTVVEFEEPAEDPVYRSELYQAWTKTLPGSSRSVADTAWYLPISLAGQSKDTVSSTLVERIEPRRPPWFTRRAVAVVTVMLLGIAVVGSYIETHGGFDCLYYFPSGRVSVRSIDHQCIGYSDNDSYQFSDQPERSRLQDVQSLIFQQNGSARTAWQRNPRRPYVTIVYIGSLTGRPARKDEESYVAERDELEGLAVAQYEENNHPASDDNSALLNIVIANAGYQMKYADQVVDMVVDLVRSDPTVVAVTGLVESRTVTAKALRDLNKAGIPVVTPSLAADRISDNSRMYLQVVPPNVDEARLISEYAKRELKVSKARIYWTIGDERELENDLYVKTLLSDLGEFLPKSVDQTKGSTGIDVERITEFRGQRLDEECGYDGVLIFAGRWTEYGNFLQELRKCNGNYPLHLVADNSVTRYLANPVLRQNAPGDLPMVYVSKSTLGSCEYLISRSGDDTRGRFLRMIRDESNLLNPRRCTGGIGGPAEQVGERFPLAYDSIMLIIDAVQNLAGRLHSEKWDPRSINPVSVHAEMFGQYSVAPAGSSKNDDEESKKYTQKPFDGVSGNIWFDLSGVPVHKRISLLALRDISDPKQLPVEVFHCGIARAGDDPACRRPEVNQR